MARRTQPPPPPEDFEEHILDTDVGEEMRSSFLEYAYSVIYSRALPDARDGLKPVQRRILYTMDDMSLRPDRGHVKSARVVGEVMGRLHPHGDSAIYDALVRMVQPWAMRLATIDGHGNFGSPDDPPAAMRYTECRMAPAALAMTTSIDEDTVDFRPNYDSREMEPSVLPAAIPHLVVNGSTGIAVGMATNMAPHNLVEVVAALRHLITHPRADVADLMRFVPGPDLPTGGKIVGLDGIRDAYETGRGTFRMRATAKVESLTARRKGIVVTELPYAVGTEKVIEKIKTQVQAKKLTGISDVKDLSDRHKGLRLVIEVKNGYHPEALLEQLYKQTPLEDTFGINNVALVDGQPRTLGLVQLLQVFLDHRFEVVRRRSEFRRNRAADRLHLVQGLLVAILDIDEVIAVIRGSDDTATARTRLMQVFDLTEAQTTYILEMPLRRLTKFSTLELETERDELQQAIADLEEILGDEKLLRRVVSTELADVAKTYGTPRRTVLLESAGATATATVPLEVADDPCFVYLSASGLLARTLDRSAPGGAEEGTADRARHDVVTAAVRATARGEVGVVTTAGRIVRLPVLDLPTLPGTASHPHLQGGAPVTEFVELEKREGVVGLCSLDEDSPGLVIGTRAGVVKRTRPEYPTKDSFEVIGLDDKDSVVSAVELTTGEEDLFLVTTDAQLLRFNASLVRPQGRAGGGVAGIKVAAKQHLLGLYVAPAGEDAPEAVVVTVAEAAEGTLGGETGTVKVTAAEEFPSKGRATGGVRGHRFLKGEQRLEHAWVGVAPARAATAGGAPLQLPAVDRRRDGSGVPLEQPVTAVGGAVGALVVGHTAAPEVSDAPGTSPDQTD